MKRRPLVLVFLSLVAGIILATVLGVETTPLWSVVGALTSLVTLTITEILHVRGSTVIVVIVIIFSGIGLYGAKYFEPEGLYSELNTMETVRGKVSSYPVKSESGIELTLNPAKYRGKLKIFLRGNNSFYPDYGDRLTIKGKFEIPTVFDDFDYREFLRKKGIFGVVYRGKVVGSRQGSGNPILELGWKLKKDLSKRIENLLPESSDFLKALLFGTREVLNDQTEKSFTKTGLAHLLAASGLHLGIILGASWWIAIKFGFGRETTYLLSLPMVFFYLIVVGFKIPLLRASLIYLFGGVHFWLKEAGIILDEWYDRYQALAGAALVLVVANPETIFTTGFQLSFGATFALALFFQPIREALPIKPDYLRGIIAASVAAQLGVSPVLAVQFCQIHPWASIVNIVAIPWVTAVIYMGIAVLISGQWLAGFLGLRLLTSNLVIGLRTTIGNISNLPLARVQLPSPTPLFLLSYFVLLYWLKKRLNCTPIDDLKL